MLRNLMEISNRPLVGSIKSISKGYLQICKLIRLLLLPIPSSMLSTTLVKSHLDFRSFLVSSGIRGHMSRSTGHSTAMVLQRILLKLDKSPCLTQLLQVPSTVELHKMVLVDLMQVRCRSWIIYPIRRTYQPSQLLCLRSSTTVIVTCHQQMRFQTWIRTTQPLWLTSWEEIGPSNMSLMEEICSLKCSNYNRTLPT